MTIIYRSDWLTLEDLEPGALFETTNGVRAIKSDYRRDNQPLCISCEDGRFAHFPDKEKEKVRQIKIIENKKRIKT